MSLALHVKHGLQVVSWRFLLTEYLKEKEGYRTDVYKDHKGNLTVGIGHLVLPSDGLKFGQKITDAQVQRFFELDYNRLNLHRHTTEVPGWNGNQRLAVASFIWTHGDGQYSTSRLRQYLVQGNMSKSAVLSYLKANWDLKSPPNQARNKKDIELFFSATPYTPSGGFFFNPLASLLRWLRLA